MVIWQCVHTVFCSSWLAKLTCSSPRRPADLGRTCMVTNWRLLLPLLTLLLLLLLVLLLLILLVLSSNYHMCVLSVESVAVSIRLGIGGPHKRRTAPTHCNHTAIPKDSPTRSSTNSSSSNKWLFCVLFGEYTK